MKLHERVGRYIVNTAVKMPSVAMLDLDLDDPRWIPRPNVLVVIIRVEVKSRFGPLYVCQCHASTGRSADDGVLFLYFLK